MNQDTPRPQITVLDAGGQYCHLIARRVRELGVYAEVRSSETPAPELEGRRGIILSGGPSSVYEPGSPTVDPAIFTLETAVLGICYGQQLMAHLLGGSVKKGERGEYGHAVLEVLLPNLMLAGFGAREQVWMNHRDQVDGLPPGFLRLASTDTCPIAAIGDAARRLYAVQFHPEVAHTPRGMQILTNFVFGVCECARDWNPRARLPLLEERIRDTAAGRNVFFFVSGGVDSSVAYTLCRRALGPDRVHGAYVDTGLMREGETEFVRQALGAPGAGSFEVVEASAEFLGGLEGVVDPEQKRHIIGEQFVAVQERVLQSGHYLEGNWILGQGTIYPDTIESGGTARADVIKTHHNRVAGIQRLIEENRILEPLTSFYKDEVRVIGGELDLPDELLTRHPFPGPGLAIRLLCSEVEAPLERLEAGWLLPVHSVGVQGDSRSYRPVLALDNGEQEQSTALINRIARINRVVGLVGSHAPLVAMRVSAAALDAARLARLRRADALVRALSRDAGFDRQVWQFPVVLIPVGSAGRPDSVVLRPIHSVDGMTAQAVAIPADLLEAMKGRLLALDGVCAVFHDWTHKPPATIEWE
jgi:GMP synthase (glutamine-hydrolysing)